MSKRKGKPQPYQNKVLNPALQKITEERAEREKEQLLSDERVKAKLDELEKERQTLKDEYQGKLEALETDRSQLAKERSALEERENAVRNAETSLEDEKKRIRERAIAEIQKDEREIGGEE